MTNQILTKNYPLEALGDIVRQCWETVAAYPIIVFKGSMGAGKTTFISKLCDYLHTEDAVSSPTFSIINEYHFNREGQDKVIYHMDWYRLKSVTEAIEAGIEDTILNATEGKGYCFIEWPENAAALLPSAFAEISLRAVSADERTVTVSVYP